MPTTRERALEAALRQMLRADEAQMQGETFPFSDVILQARAALALPPLPEPQTSPVAAGKHTPGLWHAEYDGDPCQIGTEGGQFVAMTLPCDATVGTAEDYANARLIAAAPDMLAALQRLADVVEGGHYRNPIDLTAELDQARAALARATGREG